MRWPIQNQILLPLLTIQLVVIVGATGLGAWSSLRRVEQDVQRRFQGLTETIQQSTFPLTEAVLYQMRGLSGADFVVLGSPSHIQATTLPTIAADAFSKVPASSVKGASRPAAVPVLLKNSIYLAVRVPVSHQRNPTDVLILYPAALVRAARQDALLGPVLLGLLTLTLTTIAGMVIAQHIGKRIQRIERQVARVAEGNFAPIPLGNPQDELRDLSASVNHLSIQLDEMARHIRETERARLIKQLAGGIAHQLRNSLTGARLAIQLHQRRCGGTQDQSLEVALRQLALTEEQIRGLVALIRDEHRPIVPGRISDVVREVAALVQPMCEHRQIRLGLQGAPLDLELHDADQMRAALLNLCINAIEATATGGLVEIETSLHEKEIIIEVRDDGPGISEEALGRVFDPFQTSKPDGMGLGLALVKQTADDLSGTVQYLREGKKTIFRIAFAAPAP